MNLVEIDQRGLFCSPGVVQPFFFFFFGEPEYTTATVLEDSSVFNLCIFTVFFFFFFGPPGMQRYKKAHCFRFDR